jgi:glycosyltransferase involved in cell wall biosynthesis
MGPERIRVFHIETGRHLYGGAQQVAYLLDDLPPSLFENHLICPANSAIRTAVTTPDVKCHPVVMRGEGDLFFLFRLIRLIRKFRPHILHVHSRRGADIYGGLAGRATGIRTVITRRVDNPEAPVVVRIKYGLYDRVVSISNGIYSVLAKEGVPARKMNMIHSAVDFSLYEGCGDQDWFCREFEIEPTHRPVGMIAQFIERKGHRVLVKAAPTIVSRYPEVRFILFGKGPLAPDIKDAVHTAGLKKNFIFAGFREDLHRILPCLDMVVHPASMEGLGVSLLQAAAAGRPIVASPAGGIPEIVKNGENGYLTPIGNPVQLADAVIRLMSDDQLAEKFGASGRNRVKRLFSIRKMVYEYTSLYQMILKQNG